VSFNHGYTYSGHPCLLFGPWRHGKTLADQQDEKILRFTLNNVAAPRFKKSGQNWQSTFGGLLVNVAGLMASLPLSRARKPDQSFAGDCRAPVGFMCGNAALRITW